MEERASCIAWKLPLMVLTSFPSHLSWSNSRVRKISCQFSPWTLSLNLRRTDWLGRLISVKQKESIESPCLKSQIFCTVRKLPTASPLSPSTERITLNSLIIFLGLLNFKKNLAFFFFFLLFRAAPEACESSQSKGRIRAPAPAAGLCHSHSNLDPGYTTAHGNAGSPTHWVKPGIKPTSSWILVAFASTVPWRELQNLAILNWLPIVAEADLTLLILKISNHFYL